MATGGGAERNALTILWRIENLSRFQREFHSNRICSPAFYPCTLDRRTQLYLVPRGENVTDENVHLGLESGGLWIFVFSIDWDLSLLDCNGSPLVTRRGECSAQSSGVSIKVTNCLTQEELFVTKKSTFLPDDTLTVRWRLWKFEGSFPEFISVCSRLEFLEGSVLRPFVRPSRSRWVQRDSSRVHLRSIHEHLSFFFKFSLTGYSLLNIEISIDELLKDYVVKLEASVWGKGQEVMKLGGKENSFSISEKKQVWVVPKFVFTEDLEKRISLFKFFERLNLLFHLTAVCKHISGYIEKAYIGASNLEQDPASTTSTFSEASCQTAEQNGHTPVDLRKVSPFSESSRQTSEQNCDTLPDLVQRMVCLDILREDLLSLYQKQIFSDFKLRSGDVCFPVHKSILCARSPVFSSVFSHEMKESNSKSLDVPDLDVHTLNRMLTFLYGGIVEPDLPLKSAAKLYYAADKYQVDTLKSLCSSILKSQISVSNVSDILMLADRHQDSDLTSFVHNFILSHFDDVMHSNEWEKFVDINPVLAGKSTLLLYKRKAPKE